VSYGFKRSAHCQGKEKRRASERELLGCVAQDGLQRGKEKHFRIREVLTANSKRKWKRKYCSTFDLLNSNLEKADILGKEGCFDDLCWERFPNHRGGEGYSL